MANNRMGGMNIGAVGGHPNRATQPYNKPMSSSASKGKKKQLSVKEQAERKRMKKVLIARQQYALENLEYRRKIEAINSSRGGMDRTIYKLAADVKPRKERDYFYIMRKSICFLMFLLLLVSLAGFALSYIKVEQIPKKYIAVYAETEAAPVAVDEEKEEGEEQEIKTTETDQEGEEAEEGEEGSEQAKAESGEYYSVLDPIFGFIKNISGKLLNKEISLGESPLYDKMLAKSEVGMTDIVARIALEYFPVAIIIYAITALIMMFKAFFSLFGKRIFKKFGLGSIIMIICGGIIALAGLAFMTEPNLKMAYGNIVNILLNGILGKGGFAAGYGLVGIIAIPVLILILSIFAKKRVPYSIFDN